MLKLRVVTVMMVSKHEGDFNNIYIRFCWADCGPLVSIQKFIGQCRLCRFSCLHGQGLQDRRFTRQKILTGSSV